MVQDPAPKTVLVTGANGYIGSAIARSFVRKGWKTYGLIRSEKNSSTLALNEIIPVIGNFDDPSFPFLDKLNDEGVIFDVVISTTEQIANYIPHYNTIIALLLRVSELTKLGGKEKLLVLFTSGCKDYGMMDKLSSSPGLEPHTENSPLNPPKMLVDRANYSIKTFEHGDVFDAVVIRPTNVYGFGSSYYKGFFIMAQEAKHNGGILEFKEDPNTMLHAMHVDDCGDAYVALVETGLLNREAVKGECFNMSSYRYETLGEISEALAKEYGIETVKCKNSWPEGARADEDLSRMVFGFSQWTGSEKLRALTGWKETRLLFSQGLKQYRLAYEMTVAENEPGQKGLKMW